VEILHTAGLAPTPWRTGLTWRQFLSVHAHAIIACDFLVVETVLLKRLYVLVFIELNVIRHDAGLAFSRDGACGSTPPRHAVCVWATLLASSPDVE
jgi:hypothetical protein